MSAERWSRTHRADRRLRGVDVERFDKWTSGSDALRLISRRQRFGRPRGWCFQHRFPYSGEYRRESTCSPRTRRPIPAAFRRLVGLGTAGSAGSDRQSKLSDPQPSRKSEATPRDLRWPPRRGERIVSPRVGRPRRVGPGVLDRAEPFAERRPVRGPPSARIHAAEYCLYRLLEAAHAM